MTGEYIEKSFKDRYGSDVLFQDEYIHSRIRVYEKICRIAKDLKIKSLLDIGCSFGLLVEICNAKGIDASGFDLPIETLRRFHEKLDYSRGKFFYGSANDEKVFDGLGDKGFEAVTVLDALRYFERPELLTRINAGILIVKEVADNFYIRAQRRKVETIPDLRLYSPFSLLERFKNYKVQKIFLSRFIMGINNPGWTTMGLVNCLPTYTVVLRRCAGTA